MIVIRVKNLAGLFWTRFGPLAIDASRSFPLRKKVIFDVIFEKYAMQNRLNDIYVLILFRGSI